MEDTYNQYYFVYNQDWKNIQTLTKKKKNQNQNLKDSKNLERE